REFDLAAAPPAPLARPEMRGAAEPRIEVLALVPQPAGVGDLRRRAPEEDRGKIGDPTDVSQRLQDQSDVAHTAGRTGQAVAVAGARAGSVLLPSDAMLNTPQCQSGRVAEKQRTLACRVAVAACE